MICINILVLCNVDLNQKWGDYARVFSLMNELKNLGHKIFVMIILPEHKKPRITYTSENDIDVVEIHPPNIGIKSKQGISRHLNYLACIPTISKEATKIISKHGIDYIYCYMPGTGSSVPAIRIKSKHKIPMILDLADMYSMIRPKKVIKDAFKKSEKILVITDFLKNDLLKQGISKEKIFLVPNGVNFQIFNSQKFEPVEIDKLRKSFDGEKLVVFTGALQDLNILINSAEFVINKLPRTKFVIVGDHRNPNLSKSYWESIVKEKNLEKNFIFLGKKPPEEIPKYILSADVCVDSFPDKPYFAAALPIKLLEYGACKKPVVATNVHETKKIIKHGYFGYLSNPNNSSEYADYLILLLKDKELSLKMGNEFSKFLRINYDWAKIALNLEKFLKK